MYISLGFCRGGSLRGGALGKGRERGRETYFLSLSPKSIRMADRKEILGRKRRLAACYKHLKKQKLVSSYTDVSGVMGVPAVSVRVAFSRASDFVSPNFIATFCDAFPYTFSKEWILTGVGEMLLPSGAAASLLYPERWQRVRYIVEAEGLTYSKMSKELGYPNNVTLYRIVKQQTRPHDETLERILTHYPKYSRLWLFHGRGDILEAEAVVVPQRTDAVAFYEDNQGVQKDEALEETSGTSLSSWADYDPDEDERRVSLPVVGQTGGEKYTYFTVRGDSMDDGSASSLCDGDVVTARRIPQLYWQYKLGKNAWRYFIFEIRDEGMVIGSVEEYNASTGELKLRPLNPDCQAVPLHLSEVQAIYNVIELRRRNLRR